MPIACPDCFAALGSPDQPSCLCGYVRPRTGWPPDPLPGLILSNRYRLEGRLGAGGMATVFRASRIGSLGGKVAVKVLAPQFARTVIARRFEREARIISSLQSPHIVRVYDYDSFTLPGEEDPLYYLAMELIDGHTLGYVLKRQGRVNFTWALDIIRQCARGLDEAHQAGIVHRDLKPSNIMLVTHRESTHVKLLDFGIAALNERDGEQVEKLTQTGFVSGTPDYMAPEQAIGASDMGPPADIYALGVIAYEMLSGHRPFEGVSAMDTLMQRVTKPAPSLEEVVKEGSLPPELHRIVDKMLKTRPEERYADAGALLDDLARFPALETRPDLPSRPDVASVPHGTESAHDLAIAPTTDAQSIATAHAEAARSPPRRRARWPWLVALVALLGGAFAVWFFALRPSPPPADQVATAPDPPAEVEAPPARDPDPTPGHDHDPTRVPAQDPTKDPAELPTDDPGPDTEPVDDGPPPTLDHRPAIEAGFREAAIDRGELTLYLALPEPRPPLFQSLGLRLALDRGDTPLRLRRARVTVTIATTGETVGTAAGEGRAEDGRVPLALPPLPMATDYLFAVTLEATDGATLARRLRYDARNGAVALAP